MPVNKPKKPRPPKVAPPKVNNYLKNKPTMAKSRNVYPTYRKPRNVEEIKPVVNGKVADEKLIHKPISSEPQLFIPVIEKGKSDGPTKKSTRRSSKNTKE
jgi:hypothetical protein